MDNNFFVPDDNHNADEFYHESDMKNFEEKKKTNTQNNNTFLSDSTFFIPDDVPSFDAIEGIKYDFNYGFRISFPCNDKKYRLVFKDYEKNIILYDNIVMPGSVINSIKKYYIKYAFYIYDDDKLVYEHVMNLSNKDVIIQSPVKTLGDSIAWFSYYERFQQKHKCNLIIAINPDVQEIFQKQYPNLTFTTKEGLSKYKSYAMYYLGLFFNGDKDHQPIDFKLVGLHKTAAMILGLYNKEEQEEIPPRVNLNAKRQIKEKYVVIATLASSQAKCWNNPLGWSKVIEFLKENGYKVVCIDKERVYGWGVCYNHIPWGVEDYTGNLPLQERIDIIKDADFFIGLPSGLTWLAWCCKVPIVLISGFSLPKTEFYTPYRIINYNACCGCWDDVTKNFEHDNYMWCPYKESDNEKFECTKLITPDHVINVIKTIPTFKKGDKN